jgi:hypothetical protein
MPAASKSQQRLMGMAYAVKTGKRKLSDMPAGVQKELKRLTSSMSTADLKKFAETDHDNLPEKVSEGRMTFKEFLQLH